MTELLVVIGIVVILLAVAVPALDVLRGNTNMANAQNLISSMVSRGRLKAIELKRPAGVLFYTDAKTSRTAAALVAEVQAIPHPDPTESSLDLQFKAGQYVFNTIISPRDYYVALRDTTAPLDPASEDWSGPFTTGAANAVLLDVVADEEPILLPPNIGVQTMRGVPFTDPDPYMDGGVILFDGNGLLVSQSYVLAKDGVAGRAMKLILDFAPDVLQSQYGLVTFDLSAFKARGFSRGDFVTRFYTSVETEPNDTEELAEATWLNQNTTPLLVNRYNGTLLKGE